MTNYHSIIAQPRDQGICKIYIITCLPMLAILFQRKATLIVTQTVCQSKCQSWMCCWKFEVSAEGALDPPFREISWLFFTLQNFQEQIKHLKVRATPVSVPIWWKLVTLFSSSHCLSFKNMAGRISNADKGALQKLLSGLFPLRGYTLPPLPP